MEKVRILVVDDEQRVRDEIAEFLVENKYQVFKASVPSEAFRLIEKEDVHIIILDIKLPEMDGLTALEIIKDKYPDIEVIMISGHGDMNSVIEAMRKGAADFFPKPFRLMDINLAIQRTTRFLNLNHKYKELEKNYSLLSNEIQKSIGHQLIGKSKAMKKVISMMAKVGSVENTTVLITGESGTGKELVARGIHYLSSRSKQYFHSVNCSAIPESLFESEFFGHKKGSFTGAFENKAGWFEIANKGTLFLDEIGDMPLSQQAKLLRVLEERKVSRVGSHEKINVDVRVIAASNQELKKMSDKKEFRLDLYHRIGSFIIDLPPLRERKEDIPLLINYFIDYYCLSLGKLIKKIDPEIEKELMKYSFPGNIRELRNLIERAIIISEDGVLQLSDFQLGNPELVSTEKVMVNSGEEIWDLEVSEMSLIRKALEKVNNNKSKAAELLNISWQSLDRRMKKFEIG
ncbi:MAG: sigma-54 dependent transcriptional regulator [Bacteroidales bacterium]|nr:sigma-54 dependent transcriptional regulator [Bacteroidales bacterium]MCF8403981.1 sigma-54 dependent transcriptional regulator [Bacteroidales bacterium]